MKLPELKIGSLIAKIPIIQGGMSVRVSTSALAVPVAECGGIGTIGGSGIPVEELKEDIRKAKNSTKGIIAVNIMYAMRDFYELVMGSIEAGADMIITGAGFSRDIFKIGKAHNIPIVSIVSSASFAKLAEKCNLKTVEDMYAALGAGDLRLAHAVNLAQQQVEPERGNEQLELIPRRASAPRPGKRGDIQIQGVGNLLTQMAGCCQPLPGDPIVGYITVGRGVSIHRQDCASVLQLEGREPERIIQVSWGPVPVQTYPVDIVIKAYDRSGLLRDVTQVLLNERINVLAVNTRSNKEDNTASMQLTIEIPGLDALSRLLARISQLPNIIEARRNRSGN